jgi:hypothetical protein
MALRCWLPAESKNFIVISQLRKTIKRRPNRIEGIPPAECLRNNIMCADQFDNSANRSAGNNPSPVDGRLEQHMLAAKEAMHFMRDRSALERDVNEVLLGLFDGLGNGNWDFGSFPFANSNPTMAVTDDDQRAEVKPLAPLHHLCHTVNEDDFVLQA